MSKRVQLDAVAPDFALSDWSGKMVRLSEYRDRKHIILVFNRGFI
jgi:peroxiredoxin